MSYWKLNSSKPIIGFSLALDIIILDQLSKWLVLEYIIRKDIQPNSRALGLWDWLTTNPPRWPSTQIELLPFFNISMVWNEGISFGMFSGLGIWPLVILSLVICAVFSTWLFKATGWLQTLSLGAVIGGAIGNVIDRFHFGAVADFLDFHLFGWHYPSFNVADCAITVGIALLVIDGIFFEPKRKERLQEAHS
jgi:signal peptidase II